MTATIRTLPTFEWVDITPDLATEWLEKNETNRVLRPGQINKYARDIQTGDFTLSNDAICFDPDGNLLNGQHRLHAIIKSDTPLLHGIMYNVPPDTMKNMDSGASRTIADVLRNQGETHVETLGSTVRQLILLEARGWTTRAGYGGNASRQEILDHLEATPSIRESVQAADASGRRIGVGPSATAITHWIISRSAGREAADRYIHQLDTRANEPERSAVHAVATRITNIRRADGKQTVSEWVYLLLRGYTYWSRGAPVRTLQMPGPGGANLPTLN